MLLALTVRADLSGACTRTQCGADRRPVCPIQLCSVAVVQCMDDIMPPASHHFDLVRPTKGACAPPPWPARRQHAVAVSPLEESPLHCMTCVTCAQNSGWPCWRLGGQQAVIVDQTGQQASLSMPYICRKGRRLMYTWHCRPCSCCPAASNISTCACLHVCWVRSNVVKHPTTPVNH